MASIEEVMKQLPPHLQQEVLDFAQYLLDTKVRRKQKKPADDLGRSFTRVP
jgi:hypothetical protein